MICEQKTPYSGNAGFSGLRKMVLRKTDNIHPGTGFLTGAVRPVPDNGMMPGGLCEVGDFLIKTDPPKSLKTEPVYQGVFKTWFA